VSSRKLRFDGWVLDPESGDLERPGTRIRLQEQPVLVLRTLIAHAGSVVTRAQLIELLWPERLPTVGRSNLRSELTSLRRQLEPPGVPAGTVIEVRFQRPATTGA